MEQIKDGLQKFILCRFQGFENETIELIQILEDSLGIKLYPSPPKVEHSNPDCVRIYVKIPREIIMREDEDLE